MNIPFRCPYNPSWKIGLFCLIPGLPLLALGHFRWIRPWAGVVLTAIPMALALMIVLRRIAFPRPLELDKDGITLPTGFLFFKRTRLLYDEIESAHEVTSGNFLYSNTMLSLSSNGVTSTLQSDSLPDRSVYVDVRDYIKSRLTVREVVPRPHKPGDPMDYCFQATYEGFGNIYDSDGKVIFKLIGQDGSNRARYPYGQLRLRDYVVSNTAGQELFRVKRIRRLPMARFVMTGNGTTACTIRQQSILLNRYLLEFANGSKWIFHMPLFTIFFRGTSADGAKVVARLRSHNVWYVRIDDGAESPALLAALAFIHRERMRCV